jgi:outer membrane protein assembly factor BamB
MDDDPQMLPAEIPWHQTPFFRRLIGLFCPPLALVLLWRNPYLSRRHRGFATAGLLAYCLPYAALLIWGAVALGLVEVEWKGGFGPSLVRRKTAPNYGFLENNRQAQREHGPVTAFALDTPPFWTDFRGPRRDGCYDEQPVLTDWLGGGPPRLWRHPIGGGYASFVVAGGRAFTIEQRRDQEVVAAYDLITGREVWTYGYAASFTEWMGGDGPRATPTYHDQCVFSLGATGELCCLRAANGELVWRKNVLADSQARNLHYGLATSPLVVDNQVIVLNGEPAPGHGVIAYDRVNGRPVWWALDDKMAYTSPLAVTLAGRRQLLLVTARRALGLELDGSGRILWEYPWHVQYDNAIATPLVVGTNRFFISAGYGAGCALVEIVPAGGGFSAREVWRNRNMKNKFNASVFRDGFIYGLDEGTLACLDARTGERRWREGSYGYGQLLLASGHLLILGGEGELALVEATPQGFHERGRVRALKGKTWNVPALAQGRLLVRNAAEMACFDLRLPGLRRGSSRPSIR